MILMLYSAETGNLSSLFVSRTSQSDTTGLIPGSFVVSCMLGKHNQEHAGTTNTDHISCALQHQDLTHAVLYRVCHCDFANIILLLQKKSHDLR